MYFLDFIGNNRKARAEEGNEKEDEQQTSAQSDMTTDSTLIFLTPVEGSDESSNVISSGM